MLKLITLLTTIIFSPEQIYDLKHACDNNGGTKSYTVVGTKIQIVCLDDTIQGEIHADAIKPEKTRKDNPEPKKKQDS